MQDNEISLIPPLLKGFASSQAPSALVPGVAAYMQNTRLGDSVVRARWGDVSISGPYTGVWRGGSAPTLEGVPNILRASFLTSVTNIETSIDNGASFGQITASTGPYGDTRLSNTPTEPVRFAVFRDNPRSGLTPYDCLVIQNGTDAPRIYAKANQDSGTTALGSYVMSKVYQPPQPASNANFYYTTAFDNYFTVANPAETTYTETNPVHMVMADSIYANPANYITGDLFAAYASGDTATVTFSTVLDASDARQFVMLAANTVDANFWLSMKVTLTDNNAVDYVIYDPSAGTGSLIVVDRPSPNVATLFTSQLGYDMGQVPDGYNLAGIESMTLEWMAAAPAGTEVFNIYMMAVGGRWQGTTQFSSGYAMSDARQVGPTRIYGAPVPGSTALSGGTDSTGTTRESPTVADDARFYYDFHVYIPRPSQAVRNNGVDRAYLYANYPGQTGFYQVGDTQIAEYQTLSNIIAATNATPIVITTGGNHNLVSGDTVVITGVLGNTAANGTWVVTRLDPVTFSLNGSVGNGVYTSGGTYAGWIWQNSDPATWAGNDLFDQELSQPDPGSDCVVLPTGTAMLFANARGFVGSNQRLWISDSDFPFYYRKAAIIGDGASGSSVGFAGEKINALTAIGSFGAAAESLSTPVSGVSTVFMLTDRNLYQHSGFDIRSLSVPIPRAPYGTLSPISLGRSLLGFYWLDNTGEVCFFGNSGFQRLSVSIVDNLTISIPASRKAWAVGTVANSRYYMGYTPSGGTTNTNILVWYEASAIFESVDTSAVTSQGLLTYYNSTLGYQQVLQFSDTMVYEHERPSNTNTVAFAITFGEITSGFYERHAVMAMSIISDSVPAVPMTWNTNRYFPETQTNAAGVITVTPTTYRIFRKDTLGAGNGCWTFQPSFSGTVAGGTRVYSVKVQARKTPLQGDR